MSDLQVPWVGVAAPLPDKDSGEAEPHQVAASVAGRAFVFLPLPLSTGLPAHVNGCFELSRQMHQAGPIV